MTFSPVATTPSITSTAPPNTMPQPGQGAATLSSDFETFLKMLSVQMMNQDPLNPTDSSEYAVQLATFSSVEQQVFTNDLLTQMMFQMGALGMAEMANWVGMEARIAGPAYFSGEPVDVVPFVDPLADEAYLSVLDDAGNVVQRYAIDTGASVLSWSGTDDTGLSFPDGHYRFEVESLANGQSLGVQTADIYTRITEAQIGANGTMLIDPGGGAFLASSVVSLRAPV